MTLYKLCFYVPDSHLETVKQAVFASGAGALGDYTECCWQTRGTGQFRPRSGSQPFIGSAEQLTYVEEWCVEMIVSEACLNGAVAALRQAHPYETPAFHLIRLANEPEID